VTDGTEAELVHTLSPLDAQILKAGGKLPWIKAQIEARG
jgi:aconitate hydratase